LTQAKGNLEMAYLFCVPLSLSLTDFQSNESSLFPGFSMILKSWLFMDQWQLPIGLPFKSRNKTGLNLSIPRGTVLLKKKVIKKIKNKK